MAINTFIEKVYPSGTSIPDTHKYYYLFGEKRYGTVNSVCHNGVDIQGPDMAPIRALFGGKVTKSGSSVFSIYNAAYAECVGGDNVFARWQNT